MNTTFKATVHTAPKPDENKFINENRQNKWWFFFVSYNTKILCKWTYLILCGAKFGRIMELISGRYNGFTYSFKWFAMYPHSENVSSDNLKSRRSFSQLPINVPNWQDCTWSCNINRKRSLNSNASFRCCINWKVQSRNCVNTGDISFGSVWMWPQRSLNLWPKANQSFSINAWKPLIVR